jgi:hypothetical protein
MVISSPQINSLRNYRSAGIKLELGMPVYGFSQGDSMRTISLLDLASYATVVLIILFHARALVIN